MVDPTRILPSAAASASKLISRPPRPSAPRLSANSRRDGIVSGRSRSRSIGELSQSTSLPKRFRPELMSRPWPACAANGKPEAESMSDGGAPPEAAKMDGRAQSRTY